MSAPIDDGAVVSRRVTRQSLAKTLRAEPYPNQPWITSRNACSLIQHQIKFYTQTLAMKKGASYVDIEFETHEHAKYVLDKFNPDTYCLNFAPANICGLGLIKPGTVYLRRRSRDVECRNAQSSVPLTWNNPFPTVWTIQHNPQEHMVMVNPIRPPNILPPPPDPNPTSGDVMWPSLPE